MLITLITIYLIMHFSSHSSALSAPFEQAETLIKKHVSDATRKRQALAILDQMKSEAKVYAQKREGSVDVLAKLLAQRTTPISDIKHAGELLINEDRTYTEELLDLRFQLKSVLTPSEWAKVFPAPSPTKASVDARNTAATR